MSAFAFAPVAFDADGPPGGMLPPYQLNRDELGSAQAAPFPFE